MKGKTKSAVADRWQGLCAALPLLLALGSDAALAQADSREPSLLPESAQPAWNAIGRVNIAGLKQRGMCTGTLIAPDLVLTAAHCLYRGDGRPARPEDVHFVAGWRSGAFVAHRTAEEIRINPDFHPDGAMDAARVGADTGGIVLDSPIAAEEVTALPLARLPEPPPELTLIGYRQDRPHAPSRQDGCRVTYRGVAQIGLDCAVISGASGGPVLWQSPEGWRVVALVAASLDSDGAIKSLAALAPDGMDTAPSAE